METYIVSGNSMKPTLSAGTEMMFHPKKPQDIQCLELAVFVHPLNHRKILHRVMLKSDTHFIFKGDNHFFFDTPIPCRSILGSATAHQRLFYPENLKNHPFWIGLLKMIGYTLLLILKVKHVYIRGSIR